VQDQCPALYGDEYFIQNDIYKYKKIIEQEKGAQFFFSFTCIWNRINL
jgi:hypothetical protein